MEDVSLSLVEKEIFKLNIGFAPQLVESSGAIFLCLCVVCRVRNGAPDVKSAGQPWEPTAFLP